VRFSLKRLLAVVTVAAVLLAVGPIHRQKIRRQVEAFKADGVQLELSDTWQDFFWQQVPQDAVLIVEPLALDKWRIGSKQYAHKDCEREITALTNRLRDFGVNDITAILNRGYSRQTFDVHLDDHKNAYLDLPRRRPRQRPAAP
jgi:hypothetical protein